MQNILTDKRAAALTTALVCFGVVLFAKGIFGDGDTYWHIAAGRWMLDNHAILRIDPFSYTFAGKPWQTHEWMAEIAMALAYVGLGWNGVALLYASVFALTAGLLAWHLGKTLSGITLTTTIILSVCLVSPGMLARPHILALLPLEIWTAGLIFARRKGTPPPFILLPVMTLWANLHGGFLFGLALICPFALEAALETSFRSKLFRQWLLFAGLAVLAATVTPFGIETLSFPFKLVAMPELYMIEEWGPAKLSGLTPLPLAVGAALFVGLLRGMKVPPLRLCILLGLLYLTLIQARHQLLLAVAAPLLLAGPLADVLNDAPKTGRRTRLLWPVFGLALLVLTGIRFLWPIKQLDTPRTPAAAIAHVPPALRHAPVLNDYGFGGYLIFSDLRPFIDGRAELYGRDFLNLYGRILVPDDATLCQTLAKYRIRWTILAPRNPAVAAMDRMKGWRRLYADKIAVVHVKDAP